MSHSVFSRNRIIALLGLSGWLVSLTSAAAVAPWKLVVLGDTQKYQRVINEGGPDLFNAQTEWIRDHAPADNIAFMTHVGDVTNNNSAAEWALGDDAIQKIDGVIPYSVTLGNHDGGTLVGFGSARYSSYPWYLGSSADDLCHAQTFTAGGITYLHINMRHSPNTTELNWAQGVIAAHPGKPTMITTHGYMADNGSGRDGNGNKIWNNLVEPYEQVFMTFCGHDWVPRHEIDTTTSGRKVVQIMTNYQQTINGGNGWLQTLTFDPDNSEIRVQTYSPFLDRYQTDFSSEFKFSATFAAGSVTINGELGPKRNFWNGGGANGSWQTAANWGGTAPAAGEILEFRGNTRKVSNNGFPTGTNFAGIVFSPGKFSNGYQFNGNAINLTGDIVNMGGYGPNTAQSGPVINLPLTLTGDRQINTGDWDMTVNGVISGGGSLTKTHGRDYLRGSMDGGVNIGDLYLTNVNTYTGNTSVLGGALVLANASATNLMPASPKIELYYNAVLLVTGLQNGTLTLASGQTLHGTGKVLGKTHAPSGSAIAPGHDGPGVLFQMGDLSMASGSALNIRFSGSASGDYDQLNVAGTVALGGATLNLSSHTAYAVNTGDTYTLVENDGTDAFSGQLVSGNGSHLAAGTALPEGAIVSTDFLGSGLSAQISYTGGTGNDVTLTILPPPGSPVFSDNPMTTANAEVEKPYQASLAGTALDGDGDPLVYKKLTGPAWLRVNPGGSLTGKPAAGDLGVNAFTVQVSDDDGNTDTTTLNITVVPKKLVGLWEFDDPGNLGKATVGTDLTIVGTAPAYSASLADGGAVALTGVVSTTAGSGNYLDATHNIGANGAGGTRTNQYTLVYDVKRPTAKAWRTFYQTNLTNSDDAEYFTRGGGGVANSLGRSTIGYTTNAMPGNTWVRLAISVDLEAGSFVTYMDGAVFHTHSAPALNHAEYSLATDRVLLFADNNGENKTMDVGKVAIYNTALTAAEVAGLGDVNATDSDGDGISDALDDDNDNDGMPDDWENANSLDPLVNDRDEDPDHDGFTNWQEFIALTDPQSSGTFPDARVAPAAGSGFEITFPTSAERYYTVESSATLSTDSWSDVGVTTRGTGSPVTIPLPAAPDRRFYRVRISLP